jgi:hypothetical protein
MNIEDILNSLTIQQRKEVATHWGVKATNPLQTIQLIAKAYRDSNLMKRSLNKLTSDHLQALQMLVSLSSTYHNGMKLQQASNKVNDLPSLRGRGDATVKSLITRGYLFKIKLQWQEIVVVADEIFFAVMGPLADQLVKQYETSPTSSKQLTLVKSPSNVSYIHKKSQPTEIKIVETYSLSLYHDLITFLSFLVHENIEITQKDHIYKRTMQRMIEKFRSTENRFPEMLNEDLPKHFLFLEQFLLRVSFIKFKTYARLNLDTHFVFMHIPYSEWVTPLLEFYHSNIYVAQHRQPLSLFNSVFMRLGQDEWVYEDDLEAVLAEQMKSWKVSLNEKDLAMLLYNPYLILGLIQRGQDSEGRFVWQWTPWGMEYIRKIRPNAGIGNHLEALLTDKIYVQPNLEIIVPENIIPAVRWVISSFTELKQADSVFIYEITKAKVLNALEGGWTYELIRDHLVRFSQVPVAANVLKTLEDWCKNFGKAAIWDVMVIQFNDPSAAALIAKDKKLAAYQIASFSDQAFAIRRSDEAVVRKLMASLGCPIPLLIQGKDTTEVKRNNGYNSGVDKKTAANQTAMHHLGALNPQAIAKCLIVDDIIRTILEPSDAENDYDEYDEYDDDDFEDDDFEDGDFDLFDGLFDDDED